MAIYELNAILRTTTGKEAAHKTRRAGKIPAIAYGQELKPVNLSLDDVEFTDFIRHHNASTALVKLKIDNDAALGSKVFIIREMQLHHIERKALSVDFQAIDMNKPLTITVPLVFQGSAKGLKTGGLVTPLIREVEVSCLPAEIPQTIHCDITELLEGDTWYLKDLALPPGAKLVMPADTPFVACTTPRQVTPEEEAAEAAKAAEAATAAEGGEAAEGAAETKAEGKAEGKPEAGAGAKGKGDAGAKGKGDAGAKGKGEAGKGK